MAIDELLDEHEQGERVRAWLRENALGIIGGIALGLGLIYGWQWWQRQQEGLHALALLAQAPDEAGVLQLRGDALSALGEEAQAGEAYARALVLLEVGDPARRLVELKYTEVGGTPDSKPEQQEAKG